jgi:hypothetical protein
VEFGDALVSLGTHHVLLAVPSGIEERAHHAITLSAFRWPELRMARIVSDHVPLALHAALTVARSSVSDPGMAPAFFERFAGHSWSGVWTSSVANLLSPAPRAGQYLRSFLPGSNFLVSAAPEQWIGRSAQVPPSMTAGVARTLLIGGSALSPSVSSRLIAAGGATGACPYPVVGDWSDLYGRARAMQWALLPNDAVCGHGPVYGDCAGCGNAVGTPVCPYCRVLVRPRASVGYAPAVAVGRG